MEADMTKLKLGPIADDKPVKVTLELPASYILPGKTHHFELPAGTTLGADASVRLYPVTLYGFATQPFDAPLKKH